MLEGERLSGLRLKGWDGGCSGLREGAGISGFRVKSGAGGGGGAGQGEGRLWAAWLCATAWFLYLTPHHPHFLPTIADLRCLDLWWAAWLCETGWRTIPSSSWAA